MKSILQGPKEEKVEEKKYPYLGIWQVGGIVVLFTSKDEGVLVHEVLPKPESHHHELGLGTGGATDDGIAWCERSFEPLKGKIILSN